MIKARPCAGDPKAGEALIAEIAPFVWRKHLDFAALADVHDMKRQMQTYRGQSEIAVEGHNVKVGRGGIREIEFFAQTQQLIAGGRHPELRVRPTLQALDVLATSNWITAQARDELTAAYEFLRRVEHRLQMIADEQTHALPDDAEAVERFAHFFGYDEPRGFCRGPARSSQHRAGTLRQAVRGRSGRIGEAARRQITAAVPTIRGCSIIWPPSASRSRPWWPARCRQWMSGDYRALRDEATKSAFIEFIPGLIDGLAHAEDPDDAVTAFDRFLGALQRGGRLISLLRARTAIWSRCVALILGAAPRLGDMLARQPQIMDGLIDPRFFGAMPDQKELSARLAATLKDAASYEDFLDRLRLFGQESLFLIGTRILSGTVSAQQASVAFADVAEGIVHTVHDLVDRSVRGPVRPDQGTGDRNPGDGPARQPRDDGVLRSRPDPAVRF